jgi:leader peptidase (prepilin peptidase)/N-methyltransferase
LLLVALAYPRGMGMGDVKLAGVMGLYLGSAVAPGLLAGFLAGAIYGIALIARHGSEARKQAVPFGPFLALGGVIGLLAGSSLVDWYLDTFLNG